MDLSGRDYRFTDDQVRALGFSSYEELEKYYDVAPNAYLKEFAGVSYLTKEFGDRKVDGA